MTDRRAARRDELAAFLRAQRHRLHPADVGLPDDPLPGRRRTPGLRREEVARLSGVGVTWYTWLEQGRDIAASEQVVEALVRALRLDPDQRRYLRDLAGLATAPDGPRPDAALPRLRRLVDAAAPNPASVYDANLDFVVWNRPYALIRHDPAAVPADRRNLLWMLFADPVQRARMVDWEPAARAVLGQFRAAVGQRPDDPRARAVVAGLSEASPEFRRWWAEYPIRAFRPATVTVQHPGAGRLALEMFQLRPVEHPELLLVLQVPAGPADLRRLLAALDCA